MFSLVLTHIYPDNGLVVVEEDASALAVSVLPTPVGPRKMKAPMVRLGSAKPEWERRMALATRERASSCLTTLFRSLPSIFTSFSESPSSIRETGIPVHLATIYATNSSSTSSESIFTSLRTSSNSRLAGSMS